MPDSVELRVYLALEPYVAADWVAAMMDSVWFRLSAEDRAWLNARGDLTIELTKSGK